MFDILWDDIFDFLFPVSADEIFFIEFYTSGVLCEQNMHRPKFILHVDLIKFLPQGRYKILAKCSKRRFTPIYCIHVNANLLEDFYSLFPKHKKNAFDYVVSVNSYFISFTTFFFFFFDQILYS